MKKILTFFLVFLFSLQLFAMQSRAAVTLSLSAEPQIRSYTVPVDHKYGKEFAMKGEISSGERILSVTAGAFSSKTSEKLLAGKRFAVNAKKCRLDTPQMLLSFKKLKKGIYYYKVMVSTPSHRATILCKKFTVK